MITAVDLRSIAIARLDDARVLLTSQRYDGAVYIGGYAIELFLKARICDTLDWRKGFPETNAEFAGLASFKIHKLEMLLHLTGREEDIKQNHFTLWSIATRWDPESRYKPVGKASAKDAQDFLAAVTNLVQIL